MNADQEAGPPVADKAARQTHITADERDVSVDLEATGDVMESSTSHQRSVVNEGSADALQEGASVQQGIASVQDGSADVQQSSVNPGIASDQQSNTSVQQENHKKPRRYWCDWTKTENELRDDLKKRFSHTMSRCCRNEGIIAKIPFKMILLTLNVIFVTLQLIRFANERSHFATYLNRNNIALKHLLLKDWSKDYETMPYPPTTGMYAVYAIEDLKAHVQHVVQRIHALPTTAVGSFFLTNDNTTSPLRICATYFQSGIFDRTSQPSVITIDRTRKTQCKDVGINTTDYGLDPSLEDLIRSENGVLVRLLELTLDFSITSIHVDMRRDQRPPECFEIIGRITFDNYGIHGQIPVTMTTSISGFECEGDSNNEPDAVNIAVLSMVLLVNFFSILGSVWSFYTSFKLWREVKHFFNKRAGEDYKPLSKRGSWEILRFRDVMITISCLFTIIGSIIKIRYDIGTLSTSEALDVCGILLGLACLLLWMLSLHYLAFNKVFYLLFLVLDRSASSVLRFLICIFVMYIGFALCGWAVLGPHHIKFLSFTATFQCLLALMNGDEVYVTMTAVDEGSQIAYWFNTIFITVFIFLFTIITLNVFIAIYNTTYEEIMSQEDEKKSDLMKFIGGHSDELCTLDCDTDKCTCCHGGILSCK